MKEISGGICAPKGFLASGVRAGIKASAKKRDLALVFSEKPCVSAAVYTQNLVKAAPLIVTGGNMEKSGGRIRALIANSGNANACTGKAGLEAARRMTELAAARLGLAPELCAVASTGVIGVPLPAALIEAAMDSLAAGLGRDQADAALEAIMTTDTRKKQAASELELPGGTVRIGAMVKGSGMIHPNMATMIGCITTDAAITLPLLDKALRRAVKRSFNRLTVDGDTSTNDIVLIMANGEAGNILLESEESHAYESFALALEALCVRLTRQMARDGEGASKLLTVNVSGADSEETAAVLAKSVAGSSLVKAACFGADANWGRVLCALGYAQSDGRPASFNPETTSVLFASRAGSITVFQNGTPLPFLEGTAKNILIEEEIVITVSVGSGNGTAAAWGCDLTYDYVKINGDYRT